MMGGERLPLLIGTAGDAKKVFGLLFVAVRLGRTSLLQIARKPAICHGGLFAGMLIIEEIDRHAVPIGQSLAFGLLLGIQPGEFIPCGLA